MTFFLELQMSAREAGTTNMRAQERNFMRRMLIK
jgi:hypothetical protein